MNPPDNPDTIGALVVLVQTIRPAWDTRAIRPVIEALAHRDLADLTHAAIRTAQDPSCRKPAAIAFTDSEHWQPTLRYTETAPERARRLDQQATAAAEARACNLCDEHGYIGGHRCNHNPRTAAAAHAGAAAARAAIRPLASIGRPQHPAEPTDNHSNPQPQV